MKGGNCTSTETTCFTRKDVHLQQQTVRSLHMRKNHLKVFMADTDAAHGMGPEVHDEEPGGARSGTRNVPPALTPTD